MGAMESAKQLARSVAGAVVIVVVLAQPTWMTVGLALVLKRREWR